MEMFVSQVISAQLGFQLGRRRPETAILKETRESWVFSQVPRGFAKDSNNYEAGNPLLFAFLNILPMIDYMNHPLIAHDLL